MKIVTSKKTEKRAYHCYYNDADGKRCYFPIIATSEENAKKALEKWEDGKILENVFIETGYLINGI